MEEQPEEAPTSNERVFRQFAILKVIEVTPPLEPVTRDDFARDHALAWVDVQRKDEV